MNVKEDHSKLSAIASAMIRKCLSQPVWWICQVDHGKKNGNDSIAVQLADYHRSEVSSRQKETSSTSGMRDTVETSELIKHRAK
ncbi:hypothetical protein CASFOL_007978 [Castilleja foliolosa]|uniref:Mvd1 C-terminal domain-containing protein n=1 Tax=Castilleja foliolosa TaxID=1961234 RepID=A0ABD3E360_9LAMI